MNQNSAQQSTKLSYWVLKLLQLSHSKSKAKLANLTPCLSVQCKSAKYPSRISRSPLLKCLDVDLPLWAEPSHLSTIRKVHFWAACTSAGFLEDIMAGHQPHDFVPEKKRSHNVACTSPLRWVKLKSQAVEDKLQRKLFWDLFEWHSTP